MLTCPRVGQRVLLHYNQRLARSGAVPHHGKAGTVVIRSTRGKPRNHLIRLDDGRLVVVPCGNLRPAPVELQVAIPADLVPEPAGFISGERV